MSKAPLRFALLEPTSGPAAFLADADRRAAQFAAEEINQRGGVLGRPVEILLLDSGNSAAAAARSAREVLAADPAVVAISSFGVELAPAVAQAAWEAQRIFVSFHTIPEGLAGPNRLDTTFSCVVTRQMQAQALAAWFCKLAPAKPRRVFLINQDYEAGVSSAQAFKESFAAQSSPTQSIVGEILHEPFNRADMLRIVQQVIDSGADAVMSANWGDDLKTLLLEGHRQQWGVTVGGFHLNYPLLCQAVRHAAVGHVTVGCNMSTLKTAENIDLVRRWRARYPDAPIHSRIPEAGLGRGINAWRWLASSIESAGSTTATAIARVWEGSEFKAPWGVVRMDARTHQMDSDCGAATVMPADEIPGPIRWFGDAFPYLGPGLTVALEKTSTPGTDRRR